MRIATFNINGIKARIAALPDWLDEAQPDVAILQDFGFTNVSQLGFTYTQAGLAAIINPAYFLIFEGIDDAATLIDNNAFSFI